MLRDDCDPASFDAVLGPGTCVKDGSTTFTDFVGQLLAQGTAPAWRFSPDQLKLAAGGTVVGANKGGEDHTLTEVANFGGGCIEALNELLEEGVPNRIQRYKKIATIIRERMAMLGVKALLPPDRQSNTITAFHLPEGLSYQTLHDRLRAQGYVIYAGQGNLENKIFRVANMGALTEAQFAGFLDAFGRACTPA